VGDRQQKEILGVITNETFAMDISISGDTSVWCHARTYCGKV